MNQKVKIAVEGESILYVNIDKMVPSQKKTLFYRTLTIDDNYYIITTFQTFFGTIFFFYNWVKPVRVFQITKNDYDKLRVEQEKRSQY